MFRTPHVIVLGQTPQPGRFRGFVPKQLVMPPLYLPARYRHAGHPTYGPKCAAVIG